MSIFFPIKIGKPKSGDHKLLSFPFRPILRLIDYRTAKAAAPRFFTSFNKTDHFSFQFSKAPELLVWTKRSLIHGKIIALSKYTPSSNKSKENKRNTNKNNVVCLQIPCLPSLVCLVLVCLLSFSLTQHTGYPGSLNFSVIPDFPTKRHKTVTEAVKKDKHRKTWRVQTLLSQFQGILLPSTPAALLISPYPVLLCSAQLHKTIPSAFYSNCTFFFFFFFTLLLSPFITNILLYCSFS